MPGSTTVGPSRSSHSSGGRKKSSTSHRHTNHAASNDGGNALARVGAERVGAFAWLWLNPSLASATLVLYVASDDDPCPPAPGYDLGSGDRVAGLLFVFGGRGAASLQGCVGVAMQAPSASSTGPIRLSYENYERLSDSLAGRYPLLDLDIYSDATLLAPHVCILSQRVRTGDAWSQLNTPMLNVRRTTHQLAQMSKVPRSLVSQCLQVL
jgi:hypothetical protein